MAHQIHQATGASSQNCFWIRFRNFTASDVINVTQIDANTAVIGDQAFVMDTDGVSSAGEISFKISGAYLLVSFNTDADAAAEMQILLSNRTSVTALDFLL